MEKGVKFFVLFIFIFSIGFVIAQGPYNCDNYEDESIRLLGDLNGDGLVDEDDTLAVFEIFLNPGLMEGDNTCGDLNGDGNIDDSDFKIIDEGVQSGNTNFVVPTLEGSGGGGGGGSSPDSGSAPVEDEGPVGGGLLPEDEGSEDVLAGGEAPIALGSEDEGSNLIWIISGIILVLIIGGIIFMVMKKKTAVSPVPIQSTVPVTPARPPVQDQSPVASVAAPVVQPATPKPVSNMDKSTTKDNLDLQ